MSVKTSFAWLGAAQAVTFIVQFTSSVVLARYLSPAEMGVFAVGLATIGILAALQNFGFQSFVVREERLTPELQATIFTANSGNLILQSAATYFLASVGGAFLRDEGVKQILIVLSIAPLFGVFSFMPGAQLERNGRFKEIALISACTSIIGSGATMIFAVLGYNYMSMAYGHIIGASTLSLGIIFAGRRYHILRLGLSEWRRVINFGMQILAISGIVNVSQRFCEIMLGRIAGLGALGLYSRASGVNNMLWANIHYLLSRVMLVDFAQHHRSGTPLRGRYVQTTAAMTALLWPAFAGLGVLAFPFISLVYGPNWIGAAVPLIFLIVASVITVSMTLSWELFAATGNVATQTRLEAVRTSLSVPLFVGACFISIEAAAFTRIVDAVVAFILYRPHLNRMSGTTTREMMSEYSRSAILTIVAISPAAALMFLSKGEPSWAVLIASVAFGFGVWVAAIFHLKHPLRYEIINLSERFRAK
jgi:O-antigen/teichoic acid export membrane protein